MLIICPLNRRGFLGCIGGISLAAVAGCVEGIPGVGTDVYTPQVSITNIGDPGHDVGLNVEVTRRFDKNGPGEIEIFAVNEADERREFWRLGTEPVLDDRGADHTGQDAHLLLVDAGVEPHVPDEPDEDGCWRGRINRTVPDEFRNTELGPGESMGGTHSILAPNPDQQDSCMPDGDYIVRSELGITEPGGAELEYDAEIELEFTITLEDD